MTNICRNQVLHTGVHLISADVIILLIGAVNSNHIIRIFENRKTLLLRYFYLYDNIINGLDKTVGVIAHKRSKNDR